jgi:hypothetical protein
MAIADVVFFFFFFIFQLPRVTSVPDISRVDFWFNENYQRHARGQPNPVLFTVDRIHHRHFCFFSFFQESKLRGSALVALGKLGQKLPEAVTKDMAIIQMLFNAMAMVYELIFFTQSTDL